MSVTAFPRHVVRLAVGLLLGAALAASAGCGPLQTIATNAAANAPPAQVPTLALQDPLDIESATPNVTIWPGEPVFYVPADAQRFGMILKRGQLNRMELFVQPVPVSSNATPVVPFDANAPGNSERWTYAQRDVSVSSTDPTMVTEYTLFPPVDGPAVMQDPNAVWLRFKEESINPAHRGTREQFAEATFQVVPVDTGSCRIALFGILTSPSSADFAVRGCKEVVIDANGVEIFRERASGLRADFPPQSVPSAAVGFSPTGADTLRIVAVDAVRRPVFDGKYKGTSAKPPCMTTTTVDNGDGKKIRFRVPC